MGGQSGEQALDRLEPLFHQSGTKLQRNADGLIFSKKSQAAQDKMSVFDGGELRIDASAATPILRYHLTSRALLYCLLASFLFLGVALATPFIARLDKKAPHEAEKHETIALNPIDKMLGAPEPEKPKEDGKDDEEKLSPKSAYVFAAIFAFLYAVGRILEDWLVRRLFGRALSDDLDGDRQRAESASTASPHQ